MINYYGDFIRTVDDYPVEGIKFYDLNSIFASTVWPRVVRSLVNDTTDQIEDITHVVGIESRGFVVGAAMAQHMGLPFVMVRKKSAMYPGNLFEESYELEYGKATLTLQEGILGHTSRVLIADDLVATGGSLMATKRLCEKTGAHVLGGATIVNLAHLNCEELKDFKLTKVYEPEN
tara:strand:- start:2549 stop:3076 length:528 start_codon:yes stop_codon:yes gene_type:complete